MTSDVLSVDWEETTLVVKVSGDWIDCLVDCIFVALDDAAKLHFDDPDKETMEGVWFKLSILEALSAALIAGKDHLPESFAKEAPNAAMYLSQALLNLASAGEPAANYQGQTAADIADWLLKQMAALQAAFPRS